MTYENTVLSLNPDRSALLPYETSLRESGFHVISVAAPVEARFEIEMGRCGIFLSSYVTAVPIFRDLANLFRRSCAGGLVIFLMERPDDDIPDADIILSNRDESKSIVEKIRSRQATQAT
jgi:hypothetical protein